MDKMTIYRSPMGECLFEEEFTMEAPSEMGNPLEQLSKKVNFEMFRPILEDALLTKEVKSGAGRKRKKHKRSHKYIDARWAKKRSEDHYSNKDHVKADKKTKLVEKYHTTDASAHNSNVIEPLVEERNKRQGPWLNAGYVGKENVITKYGITPIICEKGYRKHLLKEGQKKGNREKSHTRYRVEHIFGFIEGAMNGSFVRNIGMIRAKVSTALTCLVYNIFRDEQLCRCQPSIVEKALDSVQG